MKRLMARILANCKRTVKPGRALRLAAEMRSRLAREDLTGGHVLEPGAPPAQRQERMAAPRQERMAAARQMSAFLCAVEVRRPEVGR